jgi:uncharacterized protein YbbK (DUF523 family)
MGEKVRFDGGHKLDQYAVGTLGRYVDWVPVCPELEMGLAVPREALRLIGDPEAPRLVTVKSRVDHTEGMLTWARDRVEQLRGFALDGYILKSKSPSCGMERVRVYTEAGMPSRSGRGLFARTLMDAMPLLVVEEEGRLNDPLLRESFVVRVFTHHRWRQLTRDCVRPAHLVAFHARHKLLLMAHSEPHLRADGWSPERGPSPRADSYGSTPRDSSPDSASRPRRASTRTSSSTSPATSESPWTDGTGTSSTGRSPTTIGGSSP